MSSQIQTTKKIETINLDEVRCTRCNRKLKTVKSIARGMGKKCYEEDKKEKLLDSLPKSEPKLILDNRTQQKVLDFTKDYIKSKNQLFETDLKTFNYVWGLEYNIYYQNSSFYTKYETNNLEKILKSVESSF